jgi:cobaltochelatase CobT|tara:strand:- start:3590 stop:5341 length:1752 start_codon:yes stop_codon:yes gene_type:complete
MNDNQQLKQNFGAAMLYIGAVLKGLDFKFEFWDSKTAAYSDENRTFYFPYLPLEVSQKALDYIWGFVYHELGHALYTDFEALSQASKIGGLTEAVYRIFEDVWQEGKYNADTPYSFNRLSKLTEVLASDSLLDATPENVPETALVRNFFLNYGYSAVLGHTFVDNFAQSDEDLMVKTFNQALVTKLKSLTFALKDCENSLDVLSIAQMVVITFEEEKNNEDEQDNQPDQEQDNSNAESNSGPNDESDHSSPEEQVQSDSSGSNEGSDEDSNVQSNDHSDNSITEQTESSKQCVEAIKSILEASAEDFGKTDRGDLLQDGLAESIADSGDVLVYDKPTNPTLTGVDKTFLHLGEKVAGGLIPRFKRLFEAKARKHKSRHKTGRKLIRNSTVKMITRDPNLFIKKTITTTVDTHISIVLDDSGSMVSDNKLEVSHEALAAIGLAAERTKGVGFSACSFPGTVNNNSVDVICTEKERFSSVSQRFQAIKGSGSSTPMANGIIWSMEQCALSINPRKIIIVLTDGQPNYGHHQFVKDMVAKCTAYGVEVWGIGIREDSVKDYFNDYMVINAIEELPQVLLNKLTNCI